jgi:tetratricopeptide (TPR) repeat protein
VAKIKNIHQKRPEKKFRIPKSVTQWGLVGIVAAVLIVLVGRSLLRPPGEPAPIPLLSTAKTDLISLTRMLGDVALDTATRAQFPEGLNARLTGPDTLVAQSRWFDAVNALLPMLKGMTAAESAAVFAYAAVCQYEAANLDNSLHMFRKSMKTGGQSPVSRLGPWVAFNVAFLFQSRGYQDSAIAWYARARRMLGSSTSPLRAHSANNVGVAYEVLRDTLAAGAALREALTLLDSIACPKETKTARKNLMRITGSRSQK